MEERRIDPAQVKGWGIDAGPKNDPAYPMKARHEPQLEGYHWERPPQQPVTVEVLVSNERPNLPAVFGTSSPPSGLSGVLRRHAFKYSESSYGHWLPLMLADRVSMVEGVLQDLAHARVPNIFDEMGGKALWKHRREDMLSGLLLGGAIAFAAIAYVATNKKGEVKSHERMPVLPPAGEPVR